MRFQINPRLLRYAILALLALSIILISYLRLTDNYELETLDLRFHLRPVPAVTDKVILIEIGDDTFKNLGQWPIPRNYHALLIKALSEAKAKSVIFDIFFSEPRDEDGELAGAIKDAGNVYLPFVFELNKRSRAHFVSAEGYAAKNLLRFSLVDRGEGHINIIPDPDGKFRRIPPLINYDGSWHPYISFLAACDYMGIPLKDVKMVPGKYISCGNLKIPLDDYSNMIVNFSGPWAGSYKHYSYSDIIQSYVAPAIGQKPILDLDIFKDKVCVVGLTAIGTVDLHPNPFETLYPGFGTHAEIFNSLLSGRFISRAERGVNIAVLILLLIIAGAATLSTRPIKGLLALIIVEILLWISAVFAFNVSGMWIDLFYPTVVLILIYMSLTLYKYIVEWKKRLLLENELGIAKKIQESFLPKSLPEIEGMDIEAVMHTARQVGGDLYDFRLFKDGKLGVMIGDVSGKGVPASLFMAMVTSEFKAFASSGAMPETVLAGLNSKLAAESSSNLFVTAFYMIFDMKKRIVKFSNGGHLPVIRLAGAGQTELLDVSDGTPLGLIDSNYTANEAQFNKGDTFIMYTDGVTEAMNHRRELYGQERLIRAAKASKNFPAKGIVEAIIRDVRRFEPKSIQHDDITIITIKIL